jgi:signal transduction histidine kinase
MPIRRAEVQEDSFVAVLKNLSIQAKLGLIVAPAAAALAVLTVATVQPRLTTQRNAEAASRASDLALGGMQVLDEVEIERATSAWLTAESTSPAPRDQVQKARALVDTTLAAFDAAANNATSIEGERARDTANSLKTLAKLRAQVDANTLAPASTFLQYTVIIDNIISFVDSELAGAEVAGLNGTSAGLVAFLRAKDAVARQMAEAGAPGSTSTMLESDALSVMNDEERRQVAIFRARSEPKIVEQYDALQTDPKVADAERMVDEMTKVTILSPAVGVERIFSTLKGQLDAYDVIDDASFASYSAAAKDQATKARNSARLFTAIGLLALVGGTLASVLLGRTLARRVKRISSQAEDIAGRQLPLVLEALRNPSEQQVRDAVPVVESDSKDEIGSLATSFNTVLATSVEASFSHSQRRAATMTNMLMNLGRRNQAIIDRQLTVLDALQASVHDTHLLKSLFEIDHAATRMRRNAENLVLLAGQQGVRAWGEPVSLDDVMRAAMSETRALERVRVENSDLAVMISGAHVVELSHLLAELLENALSYSPPSSPVVIRAHQLAEHGLVSIVDSGVGMPDDELSQANERLANPPDIDALTTDRVGFHVVGRLARRMGAQVTLLNNPAGGIVCQIVLPTTMYASAGELAGSGATVQSFVSPAPVNPASVNPSPLNQSYASPSPVIPVNPAPATTPGRTRLPVRPTAASQPAPESPLSVPAAPVGWLAPAPAARATFAAPRSLPSPALAAPTAMPSPVGNPADLEGLVQRRPGTTFTQAPPLLSDGGLKRLPEGDGPTSSGSDEERERHDQMSGFQRAVEIGRGADTEMGDQR